LATESLALLGYEARAAYSRLLIDKVRNDQYPSSAHMTLIEQTVPAELVREYLDVLLEKVMSENHPSIPLLRRISHIVTSLG
jgi:hypothetical protein